MGCMVAEALVPYLPQGGTAKLDCMMLVNPFFNFEVSTCEISAQVAQVPCLISLGHPIRVTLTACSEFAAFC